MITFRHNRVRGLMARTGLIALAAGILVIFSGATPREAVAQEQAADNADNMVLEEIVVTSRRREERLRDVPISITTFSSLDIERNGIKDLTDYFNKTPNVSFTEGGARGERDISIRGVSNIGGQVAAIAFYVDDFNIVNGPRGTQGGNINSSVNPQLEDIERIEVLRGPQGTFFGRNATGGAINITTKKPGPEFFGQAAAEYSRFVDRSLSAVLNVPIVADRLFVRGSVAYDQSNGFVKNVNPVGGDSGHRDINDRFAVRMLPSDRLTIDLSFNWTQEKQGLESVIPTGILTASSAGLLGAAGFMGAIDDGLGFFPKNRRLVNQDLRERQRNRFITVIGHIEWESDLFKITSVTGYLDTNHKFNKDFDFTSFGFLKFDNDINSSSFSTELRIASNSNGPIDWVFGGIYAKDKLAQIFGVRGGPDIFLGLPDNFPIDLGDQRFQTDSYAIFGEATWHATDRLSLTLGGRFSHDSVSQQIGGVNFGVPDVPGAGAVNFSDFSPRVAATYDVSDQVTFYGTVSKGFKAGGLQLNITQQFPVVDFGKETLWNFEAGIRFASADNRVRANLSGFVMNWQDLQVETSFAVIDPDTNEITFINTTNNAATATNAGVEFDVNAIVVEGLELDGTVGYLSAKFNNFDNAVVQGQVVDLSGMRIPRAPKWTLSANAEYSFPFVRDTEAFLRVEWSYRSQTVPDIDSLLRTGFPFRAPAFSLWNFRTGFSNDTFRFDVYIENAFNENFFTTTNGFGFAGIQIHPSTRTFGFRLRARTG